MSKRITPDVAAEVLRRLRPVDVSVAIRVYRGSALGERPSIDELIHEDARLFWLAACVSHAQSGSHSGLLLDETMRMGDLLQARGEPFSGESLHLIDLLGTAEDLRRQFPDHIVWSDDELGCPGAMFIVRRDASLVYFHRWYALEAELGGILRERLAREAISLPEEFGSIFQRFFSLDEVKENPWQAVACVAALRHDFAVITGGPGTGKTTTVTRLIGLLLSLPENLRPRDIRMVAPTGKAAERMRESFAENFEHLLHRLPAEDGAVLRERKKARLSDSSTVHALLGSQGLAGFSHHAGNPISADLVIVDEATMVDLDLFVALFRALPSDCRVVLLGDKNQLTAVETGNVFSDLTTAHDNAGGQLNAFSPAFRMTFEAASGVQLVTAGEQLPVCGDRVTELVHSYRFSGNSEVGELARLLLAEERLPARGEGSYEIVALEEDWQSVIVRAMRDYAKALKEGAAPATMLAALNRTRILCAVRAGEEGVEAVNHLLCERVVGTGAISRFPQHGLPFIILRNDRNLGLWNGDCGVFLRDESGVLSAYLPGRMGEEAKPRKTDPFALPDWAPAFALTIHKSQGSEYNSVVVILPETKRPFITWELVYTGLTRARDKVSLLMPDALIGTTLAHARRVSGLLHELRSPSPEATGAL